VVLALGDYMGANCYACIGGTNIRSEVQKLQAESPHIVVGTPGRVFDMLNRKNLCKSSPINCVLMLKLFKVNQLLKWKETLLITQ